MTDGQRTAAGRSLGETSADIARRGLALVLLLWLVRLYEIAAASRTHPLPAGLAPLLFLAILADLALGLQITAVLALPLMAIDRWSPRTARAVHRVLIVATVLISVALAQYFAVTFVPLGADLFGYSLGDVRETVMASAGVGMLALVAVAAFAAIAWMVSGLVQRVPLPRPALRAFWLVAVCAVAIHGSLAPRPERFADDAAYFFATNKTAYFGARAARHFWSTLAPSGVQYAGYPLMHRAGGEDVFGPLFTPGPERPNLVFIIVEGLGRDFVGPGAALGGFTPFVDSLAQHSLYWENFLSTSGRTFSVLPSLFGSLPYGASGFMELRSQMPPHLTLFSLLKERGYQTRYFTGSNAHYDYIDQFLERQGVDAIVDESQFDATFQKQPAAEGGFSWGYPDDALFRQSLARTPAGDARPPRPRLDVYLTITTHEPFIPPRAEVWAAEFERRLADIPVGRRAAYRDYKSVFTTLLYTDDALRQFFAAYARRPEYAHTIFFVTGDHRLIPIPSGTRLDRYRVPMVVFSPMLREPRRFASVSSHLDVLPTVLAFLQHNYGLTFPDSVPWLGAGMDTAQRFRSLAHVALMRTKNGMDEYLDADRFLSGSQAFRLDSRLGLRDLDDGGAQDALVAKLREFAALNRFVTVGPHLYPATAAMLGDPRAVAVEDSAFRAAGLERRTPTEAFDQARAAALAHRYVDARLVLRRLLRDIPNYHDARALLGRTYGWERNFPEARKVLTGLIQRAPQYYDGYVALADVERWDNQPQASLAIADSGLRRFPRQPDMLQARERAIAALGQPGRAPAPVKPR